MFNTDKPMNKRKKHSAQAISLLCLLYDYSHNVSDCSGAEI
jgi:hypothetical protein